MIKAFFKKYQIHFFLLALVLIIFILSIRTPLASTLFEEKADLFISSNALLKFPRLKLNTSLYLFYLFVFIASILFYIFPKKSQWLWLLFVSVVFLALGEGSFLENKGLFKNMKNKLDRIMNNKYTYIRNGNHSQ